MARRSVTVVYMGDSITFGQYLDPAERWSSIVDERLAEAFPSVALTTHNRGVSGETTRMGLERFPADVQELRPDVLTLCFGLNDSNCWESDGGLPRVSEAAYVANLVEMIARGRRFGAQEVVLMTNHRTLRRMPLPSGEVYEDANARYCGLVREVAEDTGVTLCDIRAVFDPLDDATLERCLLPAPDHLHLSAEGNELYAEAVWPFVEAAVRAVAEKGRVLEPR